MDLEKYLFSTDQLKDLDGPVLVRVDMNLPVVNGKIDRENPRLQVYGTIIKKIAEESSTPIVVVTHQGRRGKKSFIHLDQHAKTFGWDFFEYEKEEFEEFPSVNLNGSEILLLDNIRMWKGEKSRYKPNNSFVKAMKSIGVQLAINDAIPAWHREDTSLMSLPDIAPTKIGWRSNYELNKLTEVKGKKHVALVIGGAKPEKIVDYLPELIGNGYDLYTTGIPGQLVSLIRGYNLGEENEKFLRNKFSKAIQVLKEFEQLVKIYDKKIYSPVDFVAEINGEKKEYGNKEKIKGVIKDIGMETVDLYTEKLKQYDYILRAGPSGVYEEGYANGGELIKRLLVNNLIILGGDSASEMNSLGLYDLLKYTGTTFLLSGGSAIHYLASKNYPSLKRITEQTIQ